MKTLIQCSLLALLFLIASCTVEKRLHLRGYHIAGMKRMHTSSQDKPEIKETTLPAKGINTATIQSTDLETGVTERLKSENKELLVQNTTAGTHPEKSLPKTESSIPAVSKAEIAHQESNVTTIQGKKKTSESSTQMEREGMSKVTRGLLIILVALALFGLGLIFYSFMGVFGLVMLYIFGLGGAIFFIAGIFVMLFGK